MNALEDEKMSRIIAAMDGINEQKALDIACSLQGRVFGFKVNDLLLNCGVGIVKELSRYGKVMADPKLYDIPKTIVNSIERLWDAGAGIITVHLSANFDPDKHNISSIASTLAGISVLTSFDDKSCREIYRDSILNTIDGFALLAEQYNYGYLVCSAQDLITNHYIKARRFKRICPGIRPLWDMAPNDQKRTATPKEAINTGADLLVMGRPLKIGVQGASIDDICEAVERTNAEIQGR